MSSKRNVLGGIGARVRGAGPLNDLGCVFVFGKRRCVTACWDTIR